MSACSKTTAKATGPDIMDVTVNGVTIKGDDIAQELQFHPAETAEEAVFTAAEALVIKQVLLQTALAEGIDGAAARSDEETADEAAIRVLLTKEVMIPQAEAKDCQHYYQANLNKFKTSPLVEAKHILLAADPRDFEERQANREKAEALIAQLKADMACFPALVEEFSSCPSKTDGGSLGQLTKGQTTPEFEKQLFLLNEGLCESPIESRFGFHVVVVDKKVEGEQMPYEVCEKKIKQYLEDHAYVRGVSQYIGMLVGEADIKGIDMNGSVSPLVQ